MTVGLDEACIQFEKIRFVEATWIHTSSRNFLFQSMNPTASKEQSEVWKHLPSVEEDGHHFPFENQYPVNSVQRSTQPIPSLTDI